MRRLFSKLQTHAKLSKTVGNVPNIWRQNVAVTHPQTLTILPPTTPSPNPQPVAAMLLLLCKIHKLVILEIQRVP